MVKSIYIANILELLLDNDEDGIAARKQLPFITENEITYTGGGFVVNFNQLEGIAEYKTTITDGTVLDGVKIESHEIEAEARLFFKNGLIHFLDVWCYLGDYPKKELITYTLTQTWVASGKKIIID
ncbi:hypothetical protein [Flavobacterium phycosphaerae]|uniref:hypothetical protein n=1 Tax=Flavobacterium phycosphaerae TaxID=2697515 RepID=UPI0013895E41|nr:hypothetical protein [Flavobacterium phycosphaerae]